MSTLKEQFEQADAPPTIRADDLKKHFASVKEIAGGHDPNAYKSEVEEAKRAIQTQIVKDFQDTLVELVGKLKKGVPTLKNEFDYVLDALAAQSLSESGHVDRFMAKFIDTLEGDEKGVSAVDPDSSTLHKHALIKRIRKRDYEVFFRILRPEKVILRASQGVDADELWASFPKKVKNVVCMFIEELYEHARKYRDMTRFYDGGGWRDMLGAITASVEKDIDAVASKAGPDGTIDRKEVIDAVFSRMRARGAGGPNAGGPMAGVAQLQAQFKAMGAALGLAPDLLSQLEAPGKKT
jgi:hypothetical protein